MTPAGLNEILFWMANGHHSTSADVLMAAFTISGSSVPAVIIALITMYFYRGLVVRNVLLFAVSLAVAAVAVHGLRAVFQADRPLAYFAKKNPPQDELVHAPFERHKASSFPSGHTQTAFSVATFMVLIYRRHRAAWFLWAALVAFSRVYLGVHFPIDVAVGALTGVAATFLTVRIAMNRRSPASDKGL